MNPSTSRHKLPGTSGSSPLSHISHLFVRERERERQPKRKSTKTKPYLSISLCRSRWLYLSHSRSPPLSLEPLVTPEVSDRKESVHFRTQEPFEPEALTQSDSIPCAKKVRSDPNNRIKSENNSLEEEGGGGGGERRKRKDVLPIAGEGGRVF